MKIKDNYVLKHISGKAIVVPIKEEALNFNGIITLNETSAFLFERLKKDITLQDLVTQMMETYEIDPKTALADIKDFIQALKERGLMDHEE